MKEPKVKAKAKAVKASKPTRLQEIQADIETHTAKWKDTYNAKAQLELSMLHMALTSATKANV